MAQEGEVRRREKRGGREGPAPYHPVERIRRVPDPDEGAAREAQAFVGARGGEYPVENVQIGFGWSPGFDAGLGDAVERLAERQRAAERGAGGTRPPCGPAREIMHSGTAQQAGCFGPASQAVEAGELVVDDAIGEILAEVRPGAPARGVYEIETQRSAEEFEFRCCNHYKSLQASSIQVSSSLGIPDRR